MTTEAPNGPNSPDRPEDGGQRGKPPILDNPSGVEIGSAAEAFPEFPTAAVIRLQNPRSFNSAGGVTVYGGDLDAVLAWIRRFVPTSVGCATEIVDVAGVAELRIAGVRQLDEVQLVRVNGRAFVVEVPAIADVDRNMTLDLDRRRVVVLATVAKLARAMIDGLIGVVEVDAPNLYAEAVMALGIEDADSVDGMIAELIEHPEAALLADRFAALAEDPETIDASLHFEDWSRQRYGAVDPTKCEAFLAGVAHARGETVPAEDTIYSDRTCLIAHRATMAIRPDSAGDAEYWRLRSALSDVIHREIERLDADRAATAAIEDAVEDQRLGRYGPGYVGPIVAGPLFIPHGRVTEGPPTGDGFVSIGLRRDDLKVDVAFRTSSGVVTSFDGLSSTASPLGDCGLGSRQGSFAGDPPTPPRNEEGANRGDRP